MVLRPTSVYIDGEIRLLYIFHFSLFLYYTISFLIIYYLIIMKVIVWLRSKLLSLANCLHVSPGHKLCIYRHVITSKFTLWWSDKLKHEWKHYCINYKCGLLFIEKNKYCIYHILVVYSYGDQRKISYTNNNTLTNNIVLKTISNLILPWHTQHTNISHTSTHMVFTSRR